MSTFLMFRLGRSMPVSDVSGVELGARTLVDERPAQEGLLVRLDAENIRQDVGVTRRVKVGS
ncbi:hypothetical protein RRF57_000484 [Xylaria bambusicola]|uniref:Uncharacterized protein n=1 Tax=Xylaria bambusicola TaxID=326684 RepID=A0AAN7UAS6_9PEZI